jgi:hypothetical protein
MRVMQKSLETTKTKRKWHLCKASTFSIFIVILSLIGFFLSVLGIGGTEYTLYGIVFIAIVAVGVWLFFDSGLLHENSSRVFFVEGINILLLAFAIIHFIFVFVDLKAGIAAIWADTTYANDIARETAISVLRNKAQSQVTFSVLSIIGLVATLFFSFKKALDGQASGLYYLAFGLTLFFLYGAAYSTVAIIDNLSALGGSFWIAFFATRTPANVFVFNYCVSIFSDFVPVGEGKTDPSGIAVLS